MSTTRRFVSIISKWRLKVRLHRLESDHLSLERMQQQCTEPHGTSECTQATYSPTSSSVQATRRHDRNPPQSTYPPLCRKDYARTEAHPAPAALELENEHANMYVPMLRVWSRSFVTPLTRLTGHKDFVALVTTTLWGSCVQPAVPDLEHFASTCGCGSGVLTAYGLGKRLTLPNGGLIQMTGPAMTL